MAIAAPTNRTYKTYYKVSPYMTFSNGCTAVRLESHHELSLLTENTS